MFGVVVLCMYYVVLYVFILYVVYIQYILYIICCIYIVCIYMICCIYTIYIVYIICCIYSVCIYIICIAYVQRCIVYYYVVLRIYVVLYRVFIALFCSDYLLFRVLMFWCGIDDIESLVMGIQRTHVRRQATAATATNGHREDARRMMPVEGTPGGDGNNLYDEWKHSLKFQCIGPRLIAGSREAGNIRWCIWQMICICGEDTPLELLTPPRFV